MSMSDPLIFQKAPLVQPTEAGEYWWCACGRSAAQPFCDASHKGAGLGPLHVEVAEKKILAWCACKRSASPPFCDGSHRKL
jgi:CDGSH iron-sulfur domain-containing protein 3